MRFGQRLLWMLAVLPCAAWAQVPVGPEFRVNTYTYRGQYDASVASDVQGNFVVVWTSFTQDGHARGVFGQRYDAAGAAQGAEFRVNTITTASQGQSWVASDSQGNVVVVWADDSRRIAAQRYDATGAPRGGEFMVSSGVQPFQSEPAVASDSQGAFLAVWTKGSGASDDITSQLFDSSGGARGSEFRVNSYTTGRQQRPAVAADGRGNFVVVWDSDGQDGSSYGVFGRRFTGAGDPMGAEFRVNTYTSGNQRAAAVSADEQGNFVVTWQSRHDGSYTGVYAQRYDAAGAPRGGEFQVNTFTTNYQQSPVVGMDPLGSFVITWQSDNQEGGTSGPGIFARRYHADGAPRGSEFQVNAYTPLSQTQPAIAVSAQGRSVIVWTSLVQDGSEHSVHGQRFGGFGPAALAVDEPGNGVFEPGETITMSPSWRNTTGIGQSLTGAAPISQGRWARPIRSWTAARTTARSPTEPPPVASSPATATR